MTATAYTWVDHSGNQIIDGSGNSLIFFMLSETELYASVSVSALNDNSVLVQKYNNPTIGVS